MGLFSFLKSSSISDSCNNIINFNDTPWKAYAENGFIKCIPEHSDDFVIGRYEKTSDKTYDVYSDKNYLLGRITDNGSSGMIFLLRLGMLKKFEDLGFPKTTPKDLVYLCAESFPKIILDKETNNECAYYKGNDYIGAAAAFICMQYEVVSNTKYHNFFII